MDVNYCKLGALTMRYLIAFLLVLASAPCWSGVLQDSARETLMNDALSRFWGRAKLSDGTFVQPENEQERKTLPISNKVANQVLDVGEISGYAEWCGLDWRSQFLAMTAAARRGGFKEKQVAFIGVLHGTAQGVIAEAMKSRPCGATDRAKILEMMKRSPNKSF